MISDFLFQFSMDTFLISPRLKCTGLLWDHLVISDFLFQFSMDTFLISPRNALVCYGYTLDKILPGDQ